MSNTCRMIVCGGGLAVLLWSFTPQVDAAEKGAYVFVKVSREENIGKAERHWKLTMEESGPPAYDGRSGGSTPIIWGKE